jgi:hypothetical protein
VQFKLKISNDPGKDVIVDALVVPKITGLLPITPNIHGLNQSGLPLADPPSNQMKYRGALLGGDIASKLFVQGVPNHLTPEGYLLQPTHLGWIISGSSNSIRNHVNTFVTINETSQKLSQDEELTKRILAFYELPEPDLKNGDIDDYCEKKKNTTDNQMGGMLFLFHGRPTLLNLDILIVEQ